MESAFRVDAGTVYGRFHKEVPFQCPPWPDNTPSYPIVVKIGASRSKDNGRLRDHLASNRAVLPVST
jgi:hypothetical protein